MEEKENDYKIIKSIGFISLISVLAFYGGTKYVDEDIIEYTYFCNLTGEIATFSELSTSGKTGYYYENSTRISIACREGRTYEPWIKITDIVDIIDLIYVSENNTENTVEIKYEIKNDRILIKGRAGIFWCDLKNNVLEAESRCYNYNNKFSGYVGEIMLPN